MNVLAFFAHPDDETMLAGGCLALLAQASAQVHYLCATRGEGGETGEPPVCSQEVLGEVREQELVCAVQRLGGRSLTFLGYTDPRVGPGEELYSYTQELTLLAGQVTATIRQFGIDVLLTHGSNGEYGHPAHITSHQAALIAVLSLGDVAPLLYSVMASYADHPRPRLANRDDPAHLVVDIHPALEQKTAAAMCHLSQNALFVRRPSLEAGRQVGVAETIMTRESLHRVHPPVNGLLDDRLAALLQPWLVDPSASPGK